MVQIKRKYNETGLLIITCARMGWSGLMKKGVGGEGCVEDCSFKYVTVKRFDIYMIITVLL